MRARWRGTYNTVIGVGNEVVAVHAPGTGGDVAAAPCVVHGSIVVVAGCHCKVNAESGYALENFCIGSVIVAFLTAGRTEGQVCGINAENRAVFNCKDDGGPACAAGGCEDLHCRELCILCNALDLAAVAAAIPATWVPWSLDLWLTSALLP